jgi:hypothetical protein
MEFEKLNTLRVQFSNYFESFFEDYLILYNPSKNIYYIHNVDENIYVTSKNLIGEDSVMQYFEILLESRIDIFFLKLEDDKLAMDREFVGDYSDIEYIFKNDLKKRIMIINGIRDDNTKENNRILEEGSSVYFNIGGIEL